MQALPKQHVWIEPSGHVRIELGGKRIAETSHGHVVHEAGLPDRYYFPRSDVTAKLSDGSGTGTCPWKGRWKHLDVEVDGKHVANGAWTYYDPTGIGSPLRDEIAFYEDKVDRIEVTRRRRD